MLDHSNVVDAVLAHLHSLALFAGVVLTTLIETGFGVCAVGLLVSATACIVVRECRPARLVPVLRRLPRVGVLYRCADDASWAALESIARLAYAGSMHLVVVDDSVNQSSRDAVDEMARRLTALRAWRVEVLRRPDRTGGRLGALQHALVHTDRHFAYVLVCDHDSTMLATDTIDRALPYMQDPRLAGVQLGAVPVCSPCGTPGRSLADVPAAFHSLPRAVHVGWTHFTGFNALLNTATLKECGGVTPDRAAAGLDLALRVKLRGYQVVYAREIAVGTAVTSAPADARYAQALGSVQLLRAYARPVLASTQFTALEKLAFFRLATLDTFQAAIVGYFAVAAFGQLLHVPGVVFPHPAVALLLASPVVAALPLGNTVSAMRGVAAGWQAARLSSAAHCQAPAASNERTPGSSSSIPSTDGIVSQS